MHPLCTNNPEFDDQKVELKLSLDDVRLLIHGLDWAYSETSDQDCLDLSNRLEIFLKRTK